MADKMSIDKTDHLKNESEDSMGSSPEGDHGQTTIHAQENQQPKRKGGRKPIYATSEERKQRNRQAQAAFRERRTEYIKQLEDTIKAHEQNTHHLQTAHRNAADECLMLRYKNSLLERILLEKGIDVQAELRAKTGSPSLGPTHAPQNLVQPPPIQRAMMKRHHQSRRSNSGIMPKIEPGISQLSPSHQAHSSAASPRSRPTPSEHTNSPTSTATFASQPALSPTSSDRSSIPTSAAPVMKQQLSPLPIMHTISQQPVLPLPTTTVRPSPSSSLYQTPSFQNHIEQLEQEYDAPADMIDDSELDTPSGPGPYPTGFPNGIQPAEMSPTASSPGSRLHRRPSLAKGQSSQQHYPSMTQLLDPTLDWDPFGLSASMAFPTQFSFDQSNVR